MARKFTGGGGGGGTPFFPYTYVRRTSFNDFFLSLAT